MTLLNETPEKQSQIQVCVCVCVCVRLDGGILAFLKLWVLGLKCTFFYGGLRFP